MISLTRTVRFSIPLGERASDALRSPRHNTYGGWPSMTGLGAYYELHVRCAGEPDPVTGYLMNIAEIDAAVREVAIPVIDAALRKHPGREPAVILCVLIRPLQDALHSSVRTVTWQLSPFYRITMHADAMDRFEISQQFDFAAAHRLHCPDLDENRNRAIFGKCNNPNGHGHNYRLEVAVSAPLPGADQPPSFTLAQLERIVDQRVIERFDHTNLNLDTDEFARLNPSVEHIAKVCHDLLLNPIAEAGGRLERVTVWETDRTSCSYPARRLE
jgi:6-pyruvoyltetrahydropterin/6-carboxytetrahydropterin synthase